MAAVAFDTLKFAQTLEAAGIPQLHAEALSTAFRDAQSTAEIAMKSDIRESSASLQTEMNSRFAEVKAEVAEVKAEMRALEWRLDGRFKRIEGEMKSLELRMTVKLGAMMAAAIGVTVTLLKLL